MKKQINEVKRLQQLSGLLKENYEVEEKIKKEWVGDDEEDDDDDYGSDNPEDGYGPTEVAEEEAQDIVSILQRKNPQAFNQAFFDAFQLLNGDEINQLYHHLGSL